MAQGQEIQLADVRRHELVLGKQAEQLQKWCTGGGGEVRADALIRYALAEMAVNDDLRGATPTSVYLALLACGVTGLVPGKLRGYSYLVTFGNMKKDDEGKEYKAQEATFMMGWRGCKHIGYRSGLDLVSAVIHEHDDFDFDKGSAPFVRYKPALKGQGPVIGTAAWCVLPRGRLEVEYMSKDELEKVKQAATRIRKSPAWDGPFRDQMERKTALKRLSKQLESGEEFFKADAIERAQDDHGSAAAALDQFTDGHASKFLGQQSAEAAAFEHLPRNTQVQSVGVGTVGTLQQGVPGRATNRARPAAGAPPQGPRVVDAQATERPTTGSGGPQTSSSSGTAPASSAGSPAAQPSSSPTAAASSSATASGGSGAADSPTNRTPATSSAGSQAQQASAPGPAASSTRASTAAPTASTDSASTPATENSADGQEQDDQPGDVAGEPTPDGDFDLAFGNDEDPVDAAPPVTRAGLIADFVAWANQHPTRDDVLADPSWKPILSGWLGLCESLAEIDEHKPVFVQWAGKVFTKGRAADPKKKLEAIPPDEDVLWMQRQFGERIKAVS